MCGSGSWGLPRWNCGRWSPTPTASSVSPAVVGPSAGVSMANQTDTEQLVLLELSGWVRSPLRGVEGEAMLWRVRSSTETGPDERSPSSTGGDS